METKKAFERRLRDGWFDKFITGNVIDIGCGVYGSFGVDPITPDCERHDIHICDAHTMDAYVNESYNTVYASHILEHLQDPIKAIQNWWRLLILGGCLVISVPDRDSYERQLTLPSRWNPDHKTMWVMDRKESDNDYTFDLYDTVKAAIGDFKLEYYEKAVTCTNLDRPNEHGDGEYSIEIIARKL